jgi:hypothetical protein
LSLIIELWQASKKGFERDNHIGSLILEGDQLLQILEPETNFQAFIEFQSHEKNDGYVREVLVLIPSKKYVSAQACFDDINSHGNFAAEKRMRDIQKARQYQESNRKMVIKQAEAMSERRREAIQARQQLLKDRKKKQEEKSKPSDAFASSDSVSLNASKKSRRAIRKRDLTKRSFNNIVTAVANDNAATNLQPGKEESSPISSILPTAAVDSVNDKAPRRISLSREDSLKKGKKKRRKPSALEVTTMETHILDPAVVVEEEEEEEEEGVDDDADDDDDDKNDDDAEANKIGIV